MEETLKIAISSGKGGTGKTFIATNVARVLERSGRVVSYLDCDVEEPNGHLFLKPAVYREEDAAVFSPVAIDEEKCTGCCKCEENCIYNAISVINGQALFFRDLCHICGACTLVCPENAIIEEDRIIGKMVHGASEKIDLHYGLLKTGEGGMSPRLIKMVKQYIGQGINILDSPPGTSCPVVETISEADLCVLVADPTPFGINDFGEWYLSETRFGPMSHAKLGVAEENSGKLVSLVRSKKDEFAAQQNLQRALIDGSPGTGCPVIASITGTDYALVITEPTVSGVHDLYRVLDVIGFFGIKSGVIVNKYDLNQEKTKEIIDIARKSNSEFLGAIPYDKSITKAQLQGLSVVEYTDNETTATISDIWEKVSRSVYDARTA
ncbi:MAG: P-loop NTPase [Desulfosalsimonas sp.]